MYHLDGTDYLDGVEIPNIHDTSITLIIVAKGEDAGGKVLFSINNYSNGIWIQQSPVEQNMYYWSNGQGVGTGTGTIPTTFDYKIFAFKKF